VNTISAIVDVMTNLTDHQQHAVRAISEWYLGRFLRPLEPFRLFGPAGTGKTTLAREVPAALGIDGPVYYAAYTGKAASVLRRKGCSPASTLHSLVYVPALNAEAMARLREAREELADMEMDAADPVGNGWADALELAGAMDERREEIADLQKEAKQIGFEWNPDSPLADASLLILDEVSMVDAKLAADIERFEIPVLVLGDPEQLEPVGGEGYYTNATPDFLLTEIHRQALESPVLELATRIRQGGVIRHDEMVPRSLRLAMEHDQILCWRNATRWSMINRIRANLGRPEGQVVPGDRIMCLTNNKTMGVFNGQQFDVLEANPGTLGPELIVTDDEGIQRRMLAHSAGFMGQGQQEAAKAAYLGGKGQRGLFTFANVITVHKAQGSEWDSVFVVNESRGVAARSGMRTATRWLYTAVSRASEKVTVSVP
jgi:Mesyanzhinovviridae Dda-like helicase